MSHNYAFTQPISLAMIINTIPIVDYNYTELNDQEGGHAICTLGLCMCGHIYLAISLGLGWTVDKGELATVPISL